LIRLERNSFWSRKESLEAPRRRSSKTMGISRTRAPLRRSSQRREAGEVATLEERGADAAVAGGAVGERGKATEETDEARAEDADQLAIPGEAGGDASGDEARADDEGETVVGDGDEEREEGGVVLEVGVHFEDEPGAEFAEGVGDAAFVGFAEALFFAGEEMEMRGAGHVVANDGGGAVGRIVVNDDDMEVVGGDIGGLREDEREERGDVFGFVVGGENDAGDGLGLGHGERRAESERDGGGGGEGMCEIGWRRMLEHGARLPERGLELSEGAYD